MSAAMRRVEDRAAAGEILSPCEIEQLPHGTRVMAGGRVRRGGATGNMLCDATATLAVRFSAGETVPAEASLVVVSCTWAAGMLDDARLKAEHASPGAESTCHEHGRLLRRDIGAHLVQRAKMFRLIRAWFDERAFTEIDTPQRVPSPGLDLHLDAFTSDGAFLITSPEYQMKRLLAGGMPRLYQLVHCFRAGERGAWHNSEFLMLEWYRAFAGIDDIISDTEHLIAHVAQGLTGAMRIARDGRVVDVTPPFDQLSVLEAFERYAGLGADDVLRMVAERESDYFEVLVERVEPALAARGRPTVLRDFPAQHASLARLSPSDPLVCERFEIYVAGLELCNGFGELTDPVEQRGRLERDRRARQVLGKPAYPIDEKFLAALSDGMPPSGGNAMGLDRLLALCVGAACVQDVMPFPDDWLGIRADDDSTSSP